MKSIRINLRCFTVRKINFVDFVETENNVENDTITILKEYTISPEFIQLFFGLEEKDMEQIMKIWT